MRRIIGALALWLKKPRLTLAARWAKHEFVSARPNRTTWCSLIDKKDYAQSLQVYAAYHDACRADRVCATNIAVVYGNQSIDAQNAGDWQSARTALQQCTAEFPDAAACRDALADLESRHRF